MREKDRSTGPTRPDAPNRERSDSGRGRARTDGGPAGTPGVHARQSSALTAEQVGRLAAVAAGVLLVAEFFLHVLAGGFGDGSVAGDVALRIALVDAVAHVGVFGGVLAVVTTDADEFYLVRAMAGAYALAFAAEILDVLLFGLFNDASAEFGAHDLLYPLFASLTVLGVAMTYRLYRGRTILPWVQWRL